MITAVPCVPGGKPFICMSEDVTAEVYYDYILPKTHLELSLVIGYMQNYYN